MDENSNEIKIDHHSGPDPEVEKALEEASTPETTEAPAEDAPEVTISTSEENLEASVDEASTEPEKESTETPVEETKAEESKTEEAAKPEHKSSKSWLPWVIIVLVFVLVFVVALFAMNARYSQTQKQPADDTALFNKDTLPRIDASLATQPLTDAFVKDFTGKTTEEMGVEYSNTHPGYVALINGEKDLIVVTEPSEEEQALAKEKGVELEITKVVNEGFVFFVNKKNPVNGVTFKQIQDIYAGDITNWKELGGPDKEIVAYQRPVNSGSQTGLLSLVMKGRPVKTPTPTETAELTMAGIIEYVANYDNSDVALGYSYYYYANEMYYNENLKYLAIDGVAPNYDTIQNESYPIKTAYYIVTRKGETNENVAKLKEAMLSARGQDIAKQAGYVPVK